MHTVQTGKECCSKLFPLNFRFVWKAFEVLQSRKCPRAARTICKQNCPPNAHRHTSLGTWQAKELPIPPALRVETQDFSNSLGCISSKMQVRSPRFHNIFQIAGLLSWWSKWVIGGPSKVWTSNAFADEKYLNRNWQPLSGFTIFSH